MGRGALRYPLSFIDYKKIIINWSLTVGSNVCDIQLSLSCVIRTTNFFTATYVRCVNQLITKPLTTFISHEKCFLLLVWRKQLTTNEVQFLKDQELKETIISKNILTRRSAMLCKIIILILSFVVIEGTVHINLKLFERETHIIKTRNALHAVRYFMRKSCIKM